MMWIVVALAITVVVLPLFSVPFFVALGFGTICSFSLGCVMLFVLAAIKHGNFNTKNRLLRMVNYVIFTSFALANWLALSALLISVLFSAELILIFLPSIPLLIFIGILLCINSIAQYKNRADTMDENGLEEEILGEQNRVESREQIEQVAVKSGQKLEIIPVGDILYIQSEGDYVMIYTAVKSFLKEQTMKFFEESLPPQFVRVHRSYIVNTKAISRIERYENQGQLLILQNGARIKVSRTGYRELRKMLGL